MGSQHSTPRSPLRRSRVASIRPRTVSRLFRSRRSQHDDVVPDDDAQPVRPAPAPTAETEEEVPATAHACPLAGQDHMGRHEALVRADGLVSPHNPSHQQAPSDTETRQQTTQEGPPAADRTRCQVVAAASPPAREGTTATPPSPGALVLPLPLALSDAIDPVATSAPASASTSSEMAPIWGETAATAAPTSTTTSPVAPEFSSVELPELSEQRPILTSPSLSSRSASTFNTAPSTPTPVPSTTTPSIPRTLPLGTTMIVQGLVQTIEVPRLPSILSRATNTSVAAATPTEPDNVTSDPIHTQATEHAKTSDPPIAGGDAPESPTPSTSGASPISSSVPTTSTTPSSISPTTTPPDTPPLPSASSAPNSARPAQSSPPSSTDVLGLLLSIAAQATAEALVPWSVPPRSRNLGSTSTNGRDGIASGLAAAFGALAAGGSTSTNNNPPATQPPPDENTVLVEAPTPIERPTSPRTASFPSRREDSDRSRRRAMARLSDTVRRFVPRRSREVQNEDVADFARAPPPDDDDPPPRPTTDAEDLVRFSRMLGFTPGVVHPVGSFERFLADMQDELRAALTEYQERTRTRRQDPEERPSEDTRDRLDHTRPHVPSTDPLPLNWWRMYRFSALPDVMVPASGSPASTVTVGSGSPPPVDGDGEAPVPVHPAIIIGLRSVSRDHQDEPNPRRSSESAEQTADPETPTSTAETTRTEPNRDGTRNYIIWIIGGHYPSNHPLLSHPNLFLGQVHPDELWMLNEFLGQVKPPTASREDIAKAGLRVVKGSDVGTLSQEGEVTENCTERCLICLEDYADEEDLRVMNCKHMFHKDCVDRWMETGRNNCPACRTKGVETAA